MNEKIKTPEFLSLVDLKDISKLNRQYVEMRARCLKQYGVDLASTDNSRKIVVFCEIGERFKPRFKRNGVDCILNGIETELKTAKIERNCDNANFQFHVMGDIFHEQYLFIVMDSMLKVIRKYEIVESDKVQKVNDFLKKAKEEYLAKYNHVQKRDIITISETYLKKECL